MSSYKQILYHIVFCTKKRNATLSLEHSEVLYKYIWGIIKQKKSVLYRINGMEDHIHILSSLHPSIALADYVRDIKRATSTWLSSSGLFPYFSGWAEGYAAFTYTWRDKEKVENYIRKQREHHKGISFEEEYKKLLAEFDIEIDDRYLPGFSSHPRRG
ncbi:IS200/IS605 family transposase [Parabacteroides sp. 52]|uniref:IS200/IS605 family transposase n=1 Tax=unclassified Parabacteroides TaxID=2649774 RepID=UPI0013D5F1E2|nr:MULTISPECIES: IS200/IS605 family transposase [unclassified Parabacteroides]MDH6534478.1 putative transposase [Parabacteroides sp. PM5-20]NDV55072.1 IS200/IS605 family transposase [Parabacteroides sp. 52]